MGQVCQLTTQMSLYYASLFNPIVIDSNGEDVGGLILFVRAGLLDDLEVYSFGPDPLALPDPNLLRLPLGE